MSTPWLNVTVCIPTHNDTDVLHNALMSALKQTVPPLEVIVVDDGSDSEVVVLEEPDDYPHTPVRVVRVTNRGLPAARNVGLMLAHGDAYLPLDADDTIREDYLELTLPLIADADVVLTGLQEHGPTRNGRYNAGFDRPWHEVTVDLLLNGYNRFFYAALFRTDVLRSIGGYNSLMAGPWNRGGGYEDWDLWVDLLSRGARFAAVDEPLLNYTTRPGSMLAAAERNRAALVAEMRRHHRR